MTKLLGYEKYEMIGQNLDIVIPDELASKHKNYLTGYLKNPKKRPMGSGFNLLAKRKDGSTFPIEISLSYLRSKSGMFGVAFVTDITLRKKAEDELKQKNKELDEYTHMVAHNINSLLNGIVGFSELLINSWGDISKENKLTYLEKISQNSWKLSNVANELLVFASMKKKDIEMVKINMKKNVEDACDRFKLQINQKSAQIQISEIMHDCFGFGLSMVKRILEKLDGYVSVESKPGEGSTFSFYLKGM